MQSFNFSFKASWLCWLFTFQWLRASSCQPQCVCMDAPIQKAFKSGKIEENKWQFICMSVNLAALHSRIVTTKTSCLVLHLKDFAQDRSQIYTEIFPYFLLGLFPRMSHECLRLHWRETTHTENRVQLSFSFFPERIIFSQYFTYNFYS